MREQWHQHNFDFEEPRAEAKKLQDQNIPQSEKVDKPTWVGYVMVWAVPFGIAALVHLLFPDLRNSYVYAPATVVGYLLSKLLGSMAKDYEAWERKEKLRTEISEIFLREVQHVNAQARLRLNDIESSANLTEQQINSFFAPPAVVNCTPIQAEFWARDWLRFLGAEDAQVTQATQDGGIDVTSKLYVAQVKHYVNPVGPAPVREISGVAGALLKQPIFFARSGYTRTAKDFGRSADVILFSYDTDLGKLSAESPLAQEVLKNGLDKDWK
ncbi:restriction endonuclease [Glutamicibacter sp. AOP3-A1-12]|uniref:restriction endonuclease n=2 Tax=Glutamicibacter TaxID=1742989 RepID=UPI004034C773